METISTFIILFGVIAIIGQLFNKSTIPTSLLLVITGMLLSFVPNFPIIQLNSTVVLNIFLPLLIYQISTHSSWKDVKKNIRPIALLSIGHVIFITVLVAIIVHTLIPELGWPLAFVIGAIISPPDSVAIVSIAEKIHMPKKVITILEGEGMLNDATALTLFRFALAAVATHQFHPLQAITNFLAVIIGETLYGLAIGYLLAECRLRIHNSMLHIIVSILTPFIAYLPAEKMGGSGVLATVVTGFVIGHIYSTRFTPEFRLVSNAVWPALAFTIESILFLLVGLDLHSILQNIASIAPSVLFTYSIAVIATIIIGRFVWVYCFTTCLPKFLFSFSRKSEQRPPWRQAFIISWSGMRGGISLAAALAVPALPLTVHNADPRALLLFLVFSVIVATLLLQGLTLPGLLKKLGVKKYSQQEKYNEQLAELSAKLKMIQASLRWLKEYKQTIQDNEKLLAATKLRIQEYQMFKKNITEHIANQASNLNLTPLENTKLASELFLHSNMIEIERAVLLELWHHEEITLSIRNKLLTQLDRRSRNLAS